VTTGKFIGVPGFDDSRPIGRTPLDISKAIAFIRDSNQQLAVSESANHFDELARDADDLTTFDSENSHVLHP
jgi:hypothetical protein